MGLLNASWRNVGCGFADLISRKPPRPPARYWLLTRYQLTVKTEESKNTFDHSQKVYFEKRIKKFGQRKKEVWGLKLGNIKTLLKPEKK
jgi:hypothetical protein